MKFLRVLFWTIEGIATSRFYLYNRKLSRVKIPPTRAGERMSAPSVVEIVPTIDNITRKLIWRSRHRCFYRSLSRAFVLRRLGLPVEINVGLRNLDGTVSVRGHCWLTLDGDLFYEPQDTTRLYPLLLDKLHNGIVCWMQKGNDQDNGVLRQRLK